MALPNIEEILLILPWILVWLTVHEWAHAYVAYLCGDSTAKSQWRISFNPFKHLDPLGFIFIVFMWFWWAKPVNLDSRNLKNPENDEIKVALAGPLSNIVLALFFTAIFSLIIHLPFIQNELDSSFGVNILMKILLYAISINWGLFFFNMIPLPPLDGSHIFFGNLKRTNPELYGKIYQYGTMLLFILLLIDSNSGFDIFPIGTIVHYWAKFFLKLFWVDM